MAIKAVQSSLVRQVKSFGASVGSDSLKASVVKWIKDCMPSEADRGTDFNLVLFDSHSIDLCQSLMKENVKSIHLLESNQHNALKHKEFAFQIRNELKDDVKIDAYHAAMNTVLVPSKSKPINHGFWKTMMNVDKDQKVFKNYSMTAKKTKTVMMGCLPFPNQQRAMLDSLYKQLLIYYLMRGDQKQLKKEVYHDQKLRNNGRNKVSNEDDTGDQSYFKYGPFALITFLHSSQLSRLLSSCQEYDFSFYSLRNRNFSLAFHTLFEVTLLGNSDGYLLTEFHPEIPLTETATHSKRLEDAGYEDGKFHAVRIEPRNKVDLNFGNFEPTDDLVTSLTTKNSAGNQAVVEFAFWMNHCGKMTKKSIDMDKDVSILDGLVKEQKEKWPITLAGIFTRNHALIRDHYSEDIAEFKAGLQEDKSQTFAD